MKILIAGEKPNIGKTTATIMIAKGFAHHGKRVLCIDTDMFHPSLTEYFGLKGKKGLSECLRGLASLNEILLSTGELDVIGTGEKVRIPGELLRTDKFKTLLNSIEYDFVFIDTPPFGMFREVYLYENLCDGILFIGNPSKKFTSPMIGTLTGDIDEITKDGYNIIQKGGIALECDKR